jgi:hypothetical protein
VLMLLGKVYARTARVMFSEGLYREAAKHLRLDPARPAAGGCPVHPSMAAVLAWQYHQLLTALPKRGGRAAGLRGAGAWMGAAWGNAVLSGEGWERLLQLEPLKGGCARRWLPSSPAERASELHP